MATGHGIRREQIRGFGLGTGDVVAANIADGSLTTTKFATSIYAGTPTAIDPDDAGAAGTATTVARGDHQHQFTCAAPVAVGTANAEGVATTMARSDHVHDLAAGVIDSHTFFAAGVVNTAALAAGAVTAPKVTVNYARVRRAANQSINNNTLTPISWDTEDADSGGFWAAGSPTQLIVVTTGVHEVGSYVAWAANTTGRRELIILQGLTLVAGITFDAISTNPTLMYAATGPIACTAGDIFTISVLQDSGAGLNITDRTSATIQWLGV